VLKRGLAVVLVVSACDAAPPTIEAFDARTAGYAAATGGFLAGASDAAPEEGCPLVGATVELPAGDAHQLVVFIGTDQGPDCPTGVFPVATECGPTRALDEESCATYRKVRDGAAVSESLAASGEVAVEPGDEICRFAVDVVFPDAQQVVYSFDVVDRGPFPRCGVP
jgi:hypothetical protein